MELFDVQTGFGGVEPGCRVATGVEEWLAEMSRLRIARALARIAPDTLESDVPRANERLRTAVAPYPQLVPCPIAMPNTGGDWQSESRQADEALGAGAGAVCIRPVRDGWRMESWCCERLFAELQARRLPVFCQESQVAADKVAWLAQHFPDLPVIFAELEYRAQRVYLPLLEKFPNIFLSIGSNYTVFRGIEQIVGRVGAERLLFGTGYPQAEPMCAVTQWAYADVNAEARAAIAAGNMQRLLEGIRR
jgi:hypothetical protein